MWQGVFTFQPLKNVKNGLSRHFGVEGLGKWFYRLPRYLLHLCQTFSRHGVILYAFALFLRTPMHRLSMTEENKLTQRQYVTLCLAAARGPNPGFDRVAMGLSKDEAAYFAARGYTTSNRQGRIVTTPEGDRAVCAALARLLACIWSDKTSALPQDWTPQNPATGQADVTALVVNDIFKTGIYTTLAKLPEGQRVAHYFNMVNNQAKDFTACQFPEGTRFSQACTFSWGLPSVRDSLLCRPDVARRYFALCQALRRQLSLHAYV